MAAGPLLAVSAGCVAAFSSVWAKLFLGDEILLNHCKDWSSKQQDCDWLLVPLRLLCGVLLLFCNTVMLTFFSKALSLCSSSAEATVTTTAANFLSSGILGRLVFAERHSSLWFAGISLAVLGLLLLHGSTSPPQEDKKQR